MKTTKIILTISLTICLFIFCSCSATVAENSNSNANTNKAATLAIEAQILYQTSSQPVSRANLYLLDVDLMNVDVADYKSMKDSDSIKKYMMSASPAQRIKFVTSLDLGTQKLFKELEMKAAEKKVDAPRQPFPSESDEDTKVTLLLDGIKNLRESPETASHFIKSFETDFQGKAVVMDILPDKSYWIMGVNKTRADYVFWNYKITPVAGENKILLDQKNAEYCR